MNARKISKKSYEAVVDYILTYAINQIEDEIPGIVAERLGFEEEFDEILDQFFAYLDNRRWKIRAIDPSKT